MYYTFYPVAYAGCRLQLIQQQQQRKKKEKREKRKLLKVFSGHMQINFQRVLHESARHFLLSFLSFSLSLSFRALCCLNILNVCLVFAQAFMHHTHCVHTAYDRRMFGIIACILYSFRRINIPGLDVFIFLYAPNSIKVKKKQLQKKKKNEK